MLSKDEYLGDITAATGIYFGLFLHFFIRIKLLKSVVTSVMNWYTVSLTKMTKLAQSVTAMYLLKTEVTTCKYKVQVFCLPIRKKAPYLSRNIGLKLLIRV